MGKYRIALKDGNVHEIEGENFFITVQGERHELFAHSAWIRGGTYDYQVSHVRSGLKFCEISPIEWRLAGGDLREAGRLAAFRKVEVVGEARARSVLAGAKPLL